MAFFCLFLLLVRRINETARIHVNRIYLVLLNVLTVKEQWQNKTIVELQEEMKEEGNGRIVIGSSSFLFSSNKIKLIFWFL